MTRTLGIDPGRKGALVLLDGRDVLYQRRADGPDGYHLHPPNADPSEVAMLAALHDVAEAGRPGLVLLEGPSWMGHKGSGEGRMSPQNAGRSGIEHGAWRALLLALGWPYEVVSPRDWRRRAGIKVPPKGDAKQATIDRVARLLPGLDLTPGKVRTPHDGLADAAGMAIAAEALGGWPVPG